MFKLYKVYLKIQMFVKIINKTKQKQTEILEEKTDTMLVDELRVKIIEQRIRKYCDTLLEIFQAE